MWVAVWKSGASPDTSHLNLPLVVRSTFLNTILVSVDLYSCGLMFKSQNFVYRGLQRRKGYVRDLILKVDHNMNICVSSQKARGYSEPKQMS